MNAILTESPASLALIVITVAVTIIAFGNERFWRFMALEPYRMFAEREFHGVVTSGLVHGDYVHLLFNMMTLFFFGPSLEDKVGSDIFLIIYVASLIGGSLYPLVKFRNDPNYVAIGASGAISGLLFSYCMFYPLNVIYIFGVMPIPAFLFTILYLAYSMFAMRRNQDNIGHEAHLAGALTGVVATLIAYPDVIRILRQHINSIF